MAEATASQPGAVLPDFSRHDRPGVVRHASVYRFASFLSHRHGTGCIVAVGINSAQPFFMIDAETPWNRRHVRHERWVDGDLTDIAIQDIFGQSVAVCAGALERAPEPGRLLDRLARIAPHALAVIVTAPLTDASAAAAQPAGGPTPGADLDAFAHLLESHGLSPTFHGLTVADNPGSQRSTMVGIIDHCPLAVGRRPPGDFRPLTLVNTFNDIDIASQMVCKFLDDGIDVLVQDNWSSDGTFEELAALAAARPGLRLERYPQDGPSRYFDLGALCRDKEQIAARYPGRWIIHHDSDEIRCSPWPGISFRGGLYLAEQMGFNAVDFTVCEFRPVDDGFRKGVDLESHIGNFEFSRLASHMTQIKAWRQGTERVDLATGAGHDVRFPQRRVFPYKFLLKHYPMRSPAQARRKVFGERRQRFAPHERRRGWHYQYDAISPGNLFIWDIGGLTRFDETETRRTYLLELISGVGVLPQTSQNSGAQGDLADERNGPVRPDASPEAADSVAPAPPFRPDEPVAAAAAEVVDSPPRGLAYGGAPVSAPPARDVVGCFISAASFRTPDHVQQSAWIEHAPFWFWLVATHRPATAVVLGPETPGAFLALCQAVQADGMPTRCVAIDTRAGHGADSALRTVREEIAARSWDFASVSSGAPLEAMRSDGVPCIDLIHVDGRQFPQGALGLRDAWGAALSPRAVVVCHGTDGRLWDELKSYPHFAFTHGRGLGVAGIGAQADATLPALFALAGDEGAAAPVRQAYGQLGRAVSERFARLNQRELLAQKDAELDAQTAGIALMNSEFSAAKERIAALEAWANDGFAVVQAARDQVARVSEELAAARAGFIGHAVERDRSWRKLFQHRVGAEAARIPWYARRLRQAVRTFDRRGGLAAFPDSAELVLQLDRDLLLGSGLFDADYYLQRNPDVRAAGVDPAIHYLRSGATEGRNPGPRFDAQAYLDRNPDVRAAGTNPLIHYLRFGAEEGREISPIGQNGSI